MQTALFRIWTQVAKFTSNNPKNDIISISQDMLFWQWLHFQSEFGYYISFSVSMLTFYVIWRL